MYSQQVGPRVVKLLGGMVLSKQAAERENSILAMWHKIVNTLQECALQAQPSQDHDYEGKSCILFCRETLKCNPHFSGNN